MAPRAIDHLVWAVRDLDAAAAILEGAGFTLTPRAQHPPGMGTANRLVQFADRSFLELLEVDRPDTVNEHDPTADPAFFGFGAYSRSFLASGSGLSQLVIRSDDASGDAGRFAGAGLGSFATFDFGRMATQPDGSTREVAFRLAFAWTPALPWLGCFACQNRFPENFWKAAFQQHANRASGIAGVIVSAPDPASAGAFLGGVVEGRTRSAADGSIIELAEKRRIEIMTPADFAQRQPAAPPMPDHQAVFAAVLLSGEGDGIAPVQAGPLGRSLILPA